MFLEDWKSNTIGSIEEQGFISATSFISVFEKFTKAIDIEIMFLYNMYRS